MADWTLAPLVALVLCDPTVGTTDQMTCVHYRSLPYVTCMRVAEVMRERRRGEQAPLPACIKLEAAKEMTNVFLSGSK